ncbi:MAG: hypothetical protein ACI9YT_001952, partial [Halobacteriales archaeon]
MSGNSIPTATATQFLGSVDPATQKSGRYPDQASKSWSGSSSTVRFIESRRALA